MEELLDKNTNWRHTCQCPVHARDLLASFLQLGGTNLRQSHDVDGHCMGSLVLGDTNLRELESIAIAWVYIASSLVMQPEAARVNG